jgi:hypothetical protein
VKRSVVFGGTFRRCGHGDQVQLVRQAVAEMEECLRYPGWNDVRSIKRRIRYIIRTAKEYGIEVERGQ